MADSKFQKKLLALVADYTQPCSPAESAERLRHLVRSHVLRFIDMKHRPERFFLAHRLLATQMLGGFGIRFTVQYNLFAGSIVGLGDAEQVALLDGMQERGELGCFALTEVNAGVMSGLIVETTATWEGGQFRIHTPYPGAAKNWISQGTVADWVVVIARLVVGGVDHGPHPFLLRMRSADQLAAGIHVEDMGRKTVANDLDNARLHFVDCLAPRDALLRRFACVTEDGSYKTTHPGVRMKIEVIGQRLLTGRLVIAEAAVVASRVLLLKTQAYAKAKLCHGLDGKLPLAELPQLKLLFDSASAALGRVEAFCASVEAQLSECLRQDGIPDEELVQAICIAKVRCIEVASSVLRGLEEEVGSYALMSGSGFEHKDMLLCCRFAEGDSRVLKMKIARDRIRKIRHDGVFSEVWKGVLRGGASQRAESMLALKLARAMDDARRCGAVAQVWNEQWKTVYALADIICDRYVDSVNAMSCDGFPESIVPRL